MVLQVIFINECRAHVQVFIRVGTGEVLVIFIIAYFRAGTGEVLVIFTKVGAGWVQAIINLGRASVLVFINLVRASVLVFRAGTG